MLIATECLFPANVDGLLMEDLFKVFPEGRMEGYYDFEKGYDEDELGFEDENGKQYYVYSRCGHVRIGSHDNDETPSVLALKEFLLSSVK